MSGPAEWANRIRTWLPEGRALPEPVWQQRHRGILVVIFLHVPVLAAFAALRGLGIGHGLAEGSMVAALGLLAAVPRGDRRFRSGAAALALFTCSALLVHLSGGVIEMHFHFFVVLGVLTLYQDWQPFLLGIGFVVLHHGILGTLAPATVYDHASARSRPWLWALIHGGFVLAASATYLVSWRMNEKSRADAERLQAELLEAQRRESVGRLAAGLAHEINTPIQYVGDNLAFLGQTCATLTRFLEQRRAECECDPGREHTAAQAADLAFLIDEVPAALQGALDGVEQVGRIVQAIKGIGGAGAPDLEPLSINQVLTDAITVSSAEWRPVAEVDMELGEAPPVAGDAGALGQVFLHLISNAAQAIAERGSGPSGRITLRTGVEAGAVVVTVADNGCGIPPDIAGKVFDQFFTTKVVGRGAGQGLAFSRTVIDRHQGEISFTSEPGRGTTFVVRLPADDEQAAA